MTKKKVAHIFIGTILVIANLTACQQSDNRVVSDRQSTGENDIAETTKQADTQDIDTITLNGKEYYMIATELQLRSISTYGLNKNYMQQNDIEISDEEWIPIGTSDNPFTGSYNGNGFKIIGFTDKHSDSTLFGSTNSADLYNITFQTKIQKMLITKKGFAKTRTNVRFMIYFLNIIENIELIR